MSNGARCTVCGQIAWVPAGSQGAQGFQDAMPQCEGCGLPRLRHRSLAELQGAFDNSVRRLEHDMLNPPRRPRAAISWRSLAFGAVLGAGVACALAYFFGGHF
jgi:hypothetical protein